MGIFKRKKIEKESNVAKTPADKAPVDKFSKKKFYFLLWNILSMAFYCCYVFYIVIKVAEGNFLSKMIKWLLYIYIFAFVLLVLISIGNKRKLKSRLKNYKSAVNFLKYFIQIVCFVLSIVTAISAFLTTGKADAQALSYALVSLVMTVIMVIFEVVKIIIRRNIPTVKRNFLEIREMKEEEAIRLGKKKPKPKPIEYDENAIRYAYDDEYEQTNFAKSTQSDKGFEQGQKHTQQNNNNQKYYQTNNINQSRNDNKKANDKFTKNQSFVLKQDNNGKNNSKLTKKIIDSQKTDNEVNSPMLDKIKNKFKNIFKK